MYSACNKWEWGGQKTWEIKIKTLCQSFCRKRSNLWCIYFWTSHPLFLFVSWWWRGEQRTQGWPKSTEIRHCIWNKNLGLPVLPLKLYDLTIRIVNRIQISMAVKPCVVGMVLRVPVNMLEMTSRRVTSIPILPGTKEIKTVARFKEATSSQWKQPFM